MVKGVLTPILLAWSVISIVIIFLGIGFVGGLSRAFSSPAPTGDFVSFVAWLIASAFVAAPFALLLARLIRHLMR